MRTINHPAVERIGRKEICWDPDDRRRRVTRQVDLEPQGKVEWPRPGRVVVSVEDLTSECPCMGWRK